MRSTRGLVLIGVLVGFGSILHVLESLIPIPMLIPGAKLGLANSATLMALALAGPVGALTVAVLRPVIGGLAGGGLMSAGFVLSLSGALLSGLVMTVLWKTLGEGAPAGRLGRGRLSLIGLSLAGGVAHNLGQLAAAAFYVGPLTALGYVGPLMVAGLAAGYAVGHLSEVLTRASVVRMAFTRAATGLVGRPPEGRTLHVR